MSAFTNPLDSIKVASPCSADWEGMVGNNRQRFCGQCKLNVYNLSGMTKSEAENLLMNSEGRVCARFFRRSDGTILTKDCPVGWAAVKKRISRVWTAVASMLITMFSGIGIVSVYQNMSVESEPHVMGAIEKIEQPNTKRVIIEKEPLMGRVVDEGEFKMGEVSVEE